MKNLIWLLLACFILVNCHDNDDSPRGINSEEKFVKNIYNNENEYDSDGFLTQSNVIINGQPPLELSYEYSPL